MTDKKNTERIPEDIIEDIRQQTPWRRKMKNGPTTS
jgi:hypothetical protein